MQDKDGYIVSLYFMLKDNREKNVKKKKKMEINPLFKIFVGPEKDRFFKESEGGCTF